MAIVFAVLAAVFAVLAARAYLTAPLTSPPVQTVPGPAKTEPDVIVSSPPAARCYRVYWLDAASVLPRTASPSLPAAWRNAIGIVLPCQ